MERERESERETSHASAYLCNLACKERTQLGTHIVRLSIRLQEKEAELVQSLERVCRLDPCRSQYFHPWQGPDFIPAHCIFRFFLTACSSLLHPAADKMSLIRKWFYVVLRFCCRLCLSSSWFPSSFCCHTFPGLVS